MVAVDSIPGMTTARLYAVLVNPTDYLTSVSGWDDMQGRVETTTSFYQDPDGWATPNNNNPLLYDILPTLRYDTWVTIGIDAAPVGAEGEIPVGLFPLKRASGWMNSRPVAISSWTWMAPGSSRWAVRMARRGRTSGVLVGQFTTDGVISGYLNLQVLRRAGLPDEFRTTSTASPSPNLRRSLVGRDRGETDGGRSGP